MSSTPSQIKNDDINFSNFIPQIEMKNERFEPTKIGSDNDKPQEIKSLDGDEEVATLMDIDPDFSLSIKVPLQRESLFILIIHRQSPTSFQSCYNFDSFVSPFSLLV